MFEAAATPAAVAPGVSVTMYWPGTTWPFTAVSGTYGPACAGTATTPSAAVSGTAAANASRVLLMTLFSLRAESPPGGDSTLHGALRAVNRPKGRPYGRGRPGCDARPAAAVRSVRAHQAALRWCRRDVSRRLQGGLVEQPVRRAGGRADDPAGGRVV